MHLSAFHEACMQSPFVGAHPWPVLHRPEEIIIFYRILIDPDAANAAS